MREFPKSLISLITVVVVLFAFCSCSNDKTVFESFITSVKKCDYTGMYAFVTEDSGLNITAAKDYADRLDEEKKDIYLKLMEFISYSYTNEDNTEGKISIKLTCIDLQALASRISTLISVGGNSACDSIREMLDKGTLEEDFIKTSIIVVNIEKENGKALIPFEKNKNGELWDAIGLVNFLRWFDKN